MEPGGGAFAKLSVFYMEKTVPAASVNFPNRERPLLAVLNPCVFDPKTFWSGPGGLPYMGVRQGPFQSFLTGFAGLKNTFNWLFWGKNLEN